MWVEREEWGFVSLAHLSRKELVAWSKIEMDGGEEGSSQLDLNRARLLAIQFLYASMPDLFQCIFTRSFVALGARGLSAWGGQEMSLGREKSERRASW